jgi:hypothetical protein
MESWRFDVREGNLSIQKCSRQLDKTLVYRLNSFHGSELRIHIDIDNGKISEEKSESNVGKFRLEYLACAKSLQKLGITHPIAAPPKLYVK